MWRSLIGSALELHPAVFAVSETHICTARVIFARSFSFVHRERLIKPTEAENDVEANDDMMLSCILQKAARKIGGISHRNIRKNLLSLVSRKHFIFDKF